MPETKILIIGAGSSGLSMAGSLKQVGLESVILDRDAHPGDVWRKRYDRLKLHTIRGLSHSAHKKLDDTLPRYVSKDDFADYLTDYAQEFDLDIRHNCIVTRISMSDGHFQVETADGERWHSEHLIMATGVDREPFIPQWTGIEDYTGRLIHSNTYKTGADYTGQRVLVVGVGNSGAEIAADCVDHGAAVVHNSIRTFPTIVKREMFGIPVHAWGVILFKMPLKLKEWLMTTLIKYEVGDLSRYGIGAPQWSVFKDKRIPMIDVGYLDHLKAGHIIVKPDIECVTADGVQFIDGSREQYDVVIAGTGYRTGLDHIIDLPNVLDADGNVIAANGENAPHTGLWFVGYQRTPAGILMFARIQSRRIAAKIAESYAPA